MNETNLLLLSHAARLFSNSRCSFSFQRRLYLYIFSDVVLFGVMCNNAMSFASQSLCVYLKKKKSSGSCSIFSGLSLSLRSQEPEFNIEAEVQVFSPDLCLAFL